MLAYGMVIAALGAEGSDADGDGLVTVEEARAALRQSNPVLAAAFAPLMDKPVLRNAAAVELGALETLISAIDVGRVNTSSDSRGEPWLYFYEDFLSAYDPDERRQAGVYYTPVAVVRAMTHITNHLLVERFSLRLGLAEGSVVTLDPAAGSGAFPLAVIDKAVEQAIVIRGRAGARQAARNLANNLFAFELLPGPYSVSHLRLGRRLTELAGEDGGPHSAQVVLTDTLESPFQPPQQAEFFGDAEVLAAEQQRAQRIKLEQSVTVVIGNPPYRRVERDIAGRGSGGWVLNGAVPGRNSGKSIFDDILDVARANTIFSHHASLYNLYVYFWRWALWKAFEAQGGGPGIVSFITGSSWLAGPGFVGLRQLARELADDIWVLDLGGDNHGANPEDNVFAIETPVAIVVLVRDGVSDRANPARVRYRRIRGDRESKLAAMSAIAAAGDPLAGEWTEATADWMAPLTPTTGDAEWATMPLITDIFPWQQPGCKFGRTWPVAPSPELLAQRWATIAAAPRERKAALFYTATSGRNVDTKVDGYARLSDSESGDSPEPIRGYGYRSFDRQWALDDPRLAKTDSPSLWQSASDKQIFLSSTLTGQLGVGPALTASAYVPDLHYFHGRGGKDIIPLWRDRAAEEPNLTAGVSELLSKALGIAPPTVEEVAAYTYAILNASAYQSRFADALRTPGLRIPMTADASLWGQAVEAGRHRLWLQTFAERLQDPSAGLGSHVPLVEGIAWDEAVTRIPMDSSNIVYDAETETLTIGNGKVVGVRPEVWAFKVSGMSVLSKWLGYRTAKGAGRAAKSNNELDRVRSGVWHDTWNDELLDLIRVLTLTLEDEPVLASLLERICDGPLIEASMLPTPKAQERRPPATLARVSAMSAAGPATNT
ncbi:type ISP restriction/modification enzyme [Phenylobacterium immobile]|uniref:type ISP restriction/modification enzyme n=1 Tax=Phenylobacterium immobile TaxID=21 RepID=UPI000A40FEFF|nr:type ISP restriction/modification enzyme [Phenylobacterium immobile]